MHRKRLTMQGSGCDGRFDGQRPPLQVRSGFDDGRLSQPRGSGAEPGTAEHQCVISAAGFASRFDDRQSNHARNRARASAGVITGIP